MALAPGGTIGILGGGQLGRMLSHAAARLGYRCHIYCPEPDCPAAQVSAAATVADYADEAALARFAAEVDLVTLEFENIPVATARFLAERLPVHPGAAVLEITQDRLLEKQAIRDRDVGTAPFAAVDAAAMLADAVAAIGLPAVLKTRRLGYDGKGQALLRSDADLAGAWQAIGGAPAILEGFVDFAMEISVVAARGSDGSIAPYLPVENRHKQGILDKTIVPAAISAATAAKALATARSLIEAFEVIGMLAVEMFVTADGEVLVNEVAPRVHNSGHWTIEGAMTDQFEQQIRAVTGLPLGSPDRLANAVMQNLIGDDAARWAEILADPAARLHLYGKAEARPGRKMGHVTRLYPLDRPPPG